MPRTRATQDVSRDAAAPAAFPLSHLTHRPFLCELLKRRGGVVQESRGVHGVLLFFRKLDLLFRQREVSYNISYMQATHRG